MLINVVGTPAPQGSKKFMGVRGGKGILVESSKAVKPWREAVKYAALEVADEGFTGAVNVTMTFLMPKPKSAKRDAQACKKPDLSKLVRSTEDALTDAGVWEDDARIVACIAAKRYVREGERPGAVIEVLPA